MTQYSQSSSQSSAFFLQHSNTTVQHSIQPNQESYHISSSPPHTSIKRQSLSSPAHTTNVIAMAHSPVMSAKICLSSSISPHHRNNVSQQYFLQLQHRDSKNYVKTNICRMNCCCITNTNAHGSTLFVAGEELHIWENQPQEASFKKLATFSPNDLLAFQMPQCIEYVSAVSISDYIIAVFSDGQSTFWYQLDLGLGKRIQRLGCIRGDTPMFDMKIAVGSVQCISLFELDENGLLKHSTVRIGEASLEVRSKTIFPHKFPLASKLDFCVLPSVLTPVLTVCHLNGVHVHLLSKVGKCSELILSLPAVHSHSLLYITCSRIHYDTSSQTLYFFCGDRTGSLWRSKLKWSELLEWNQEKKLELEHVPSVQLGAHIAGLSILRKSDKNGLLCTSFQNQVVTL
mmetsp:Transcript_6063/g.22925  ORF Transcript_6063/g.22925 Transcript_6063/m.22925 type:complete len:400 (-) Transcript_6063:755-1954(-)